MHEREKKEKTKHKKRKKSVFVATPPQSSHPLGANFTLAAPFFATCAVALAVYSKRNHSLRSDKGTLSLQQNIYRIPETKVILRDRIPTQC
jgi:hypothetical protein